MIDPAALLADLSRLVSQLEADLLARSDDASVPEIAATLNAEYERARAANRTAATFSAWRADRITQAAVAWVLSSVFVRFLEDNSFITPPRLSGPDQRLRQAREAHQHFFMNHPRETDRDYLLSIFDELAALPGTAGVFGPHNALREIPTWLSGDAARELIQFFQRTDNATGTLLHDFTDPTVSTRFLGDLYQDLSAEARSRYALLQTPAFIEQFLLDRTLEPALDEFGLSEQFKMIDPACGSGHLVLGSFERILDRWQRAEPATPVRELVRRTLASLHGVDVNPFAAAIARFRLLLAAMRACGVERLADAPAFVLNIECGDSLLHVPLHGGQKEMFDKHAGDDTAAAGTGTPPKRGRQAKAEPSDEECDHAYASENLAALKAILRHGQYHAVMANPPYITPKDPGLRNRYRQRFLTCHMKYSLAVPFMEHIYGLCTSGGFTGQITANSFMKREFGKKLIEQFFKGVDLTHVIDTSGAYIPGHGTPTVILFLRNQEPSGRKVRSVLGIRGEPETPADPAQGLVWQTILDQIDRPGSEGEFVGVEDRELRGFRRHPWSLAGGGASLLTSKLEQVAGSRLSSSVAAIGRTTVVGNDDAWVSNRPALCPPGIAARSVGFVEGDSVRDWGLENRSVCIYPYTPLGGDASDPGGLIQARLWTCRSVLAARSLFQQSLAEHGKQWWEHLEHYADRLRTPRSIAFASIATHNHFVFDRGGKVFKQSAPVIKLPPDATDEDHFALLGVLNSSTMCFYLKQVCYPKASASGDVSTVNMRPEANRYDIASTQVEQAPLPAWDAATRQRVVELARSADQLASWLASNRPGALLQTHGVTHSDFEDLREQRTRVSCQLVAIQEELDWEVYGAFGLVDDPTPVTSRHLTPGELPEIAADKRAFCAEAGDGTEHCDPLREARRVAINQSRDLRLLESPMFKRLWLGRQGVYGSARTSFEQMFEDDLDDALLDRIEQLPCWRDGDPRPRTTNEIADLLAGDARFMELLRLRTGEDAPNLPRAVASLVADECVPFLPGLYLKASGLRKRSDWEECWRLQRLEDPFLAKQDALLEGFFGSSPAEQRRAREHVACWLTSEKVTKEKLADLSLADREAHLSRLAALRDEWRSIDEARQQVVGGVTPPVPPEYKSADFLQASFWKHRGKLDVAKERFTSYPGLSPDADPSLLVGWAGWNHVERAKALTAVITDRERDGWSGERIRPAVRGVFELLPWLRQWHADAPEGDYGEAYEAYLASLLPKAALTERELESWQPTVTSGRKRRKAETTTSHTADAKTMFDDAEDPQKTSLDEVPR